MAQSARVKKHFRMKPEVVKIFDELDEYLRFCVNFGHVYDESDLGNERSPYGDYLRFKKGKIVRDNWAVAAKQFNDNYA
jgi:hypothetical protein